MRNAIARIALCSLLVVPAGAAACDREDRQDVREGVRDVQEEGEKVENEIDENVDTDGKDN